MRIDPTDLRLAMRAHEEAVAAAQARARQTADDEVRHRDLVPVGAVSASAYDKAKAAAEAARAELSAAAARADVRAQRGGYAVLWLMRTAWSSRLWPSRGRSSVPLSSCVAHAGRREAVIELSKPCARRSDPPAGRPCMEAG